MPEATLGRALLRTLEDLNALILKASDADVPRLRDQRRALIGRIEDLVEANLDRGSQEYAKATEGLQAASATIRSCRQPSSIVRSSPISEVGLTSRTFRSRA